MKKLAVVVLGFSFSGLVMAADSPVTEIVAPALLCASAPVQVQGQMRMSPNAKMVAIDSTHERMWISNPDSETGYEAKPTSFKVLGINQWEVQADFTIQGSPMTFSFKTFSRVEDTETNGSHKSELTIYMDVSASKDGRPSKHSERLTCVSADTWI